MDDLAAGQVFAGHRIESVTGRGGMGVVYRATDLELDRQVALKVIAPHLAADPGFRDRFKRESRIAASIDHPHVVTVHRAGEDEGRLFITMQLIEGTDLKAVLTAEGRLDHRRAARLVAQVAEALDAAHERGLIHRDVKPANVLVADSSGGERAYLTDFGLTKLATSDSALTQTGQFLGTVDYVAPETVEGGPVDARADVYSLGCVLFQLLTGEVPFSEETDLARVYAHVHKPARSPLELRPDLPAGFTAVCARALAKDPADRFTTAGELGRAALAVSAQEAAPIAADPSDATVIDELPAAPAGPRGRRRVTLAGAGALALVAGVAAVALGGGDDDPGATTNDRPAAATAARSGAGVVVATIPVAKRPLALAAGDGSLFVASDVEGVVARIDTETNASAGEPLAVADGALGVSLAGGTLWVAGEQGRVGRVEPTALKVVGAARQAARRLSSLATGGGEVWVTDPARDQALRIGADGKVAERAAVGDEPLSVAFDGRGSFFVSNHRDDTITRIDPGVEGGKAALGKPIAVGPDPRGMAAAGDRLFVALSGDGSVAVVDLENDRPDGTTIAVGNTPVAVAHGEGSLWVANQDDATVTRIDATTRKVVGKPIAVGREPIAVTVADGAVWVACAGDSTIRRIDP